jgi:hypothetical protein
MVFSQKLPRESAAHTCPRTVIAGAASPVRCPISRGTIKRFFAMVAYQIISFSCVSFFRRNMLAAANFCSSCIHVCAPLRRVFVCHSAIIQYNVERIAIGSDGCAVGKSCEAD